MQKLNMMRIIICMLIFLVAMPFVVAQGVCFSDYVNSSNVALDFSTNCNTGSRCVGEIMDNFNGTGLDYALGGRDTGAAMAFEGIKWGGADLWTESTGVANGLANVGRTAHFDVIFNATFNFIGIKL